MGKYFMDKDNLPGFDFGEDEQSEARLLRQEAHSTETIDVSRLFTSELTDSGSFDVMVDIRKTSFGRLLESLPTCMLLLDKEQRIVILNEAWKKISPEYITLHGAKFRSIVSDTDTSLEMESEIKELFSTRKPGQKEAILKIGESSVYARMTFRTIRILSDRFVLVSAEDLTAEKRVILSEKRINEKLRQEIAERKRAEEALLKSQRQYRQVVEFATDVIFHTNLDGLIQLLNPVGLKVTGYSADEIVGKPFLDLIAPDYKQQVEDLLAKQLADKTPNTYFEIPVISKEGEILWFGQNMQLLQEDGTVTGFQAIARDITNLKKAEKALKESEERYHQLVEFCPDGIFVNVDGKIAFANAEAARIFGVASTDELIGKAVFDMIHPEDRGTISERIKIVMEERKPVPSRERKVVRADGTVIATENAAAPISFDGKPAAQIVMRDITERKKAEKALRESEERFGAMFRNHNAIMLLIDEADGRIIDANLAAQRFYGYTVSELRSGNITDINTLPSEKIAEEMNLAVHEQRNYFTFPHQLADGEIRDVEVHSSPINIHGKTLLFSIIHDITSRKKAEKGLVRAKEEWERTFNAVPDLIGILDNESRVVRVNKAMADKVNRTVEECIGRSCSFLLTENRMPVGLCNATNALQETPEENFEVKIDGSWFFVTTNPLWDADKSLIGRVFVARDITQLKDAEDALRSREAYLSAIIENQPGLVWLKDLDGRFRAVNQGFASSCAYNRPEDVIGKTDFDVWPGELAEKFVAYDKMVIETGESLMVEEAISSPDGPRWFETFKTPVRDSNGAIIGTTGFAREISDRKKAEELLLQTARFKAVVDLASGIAHNFNNLLQITIGNAELILMGLQRGEYRNIEYHLNQIIENSKFGAQTIRRLNRLTKIHDKSDTIQSGKIFNLADLARQAAEITKPWWKDNPERHGATIEMDLRLNENCRISGRKNEIFEVLINLIKNSTEALPQGGKIEIDCSRTEDEVILRIKDNGHGISNENIGRLFSPFFTTSVEAGRGLGLATARKIIDEHGGSIKADSDAKDGTAFTLILPAAVENEETSKVSGEIAVDEPLNILVIDDLEANVKLIQEGLGMFRHHIVGVLSGEEGVAAFKKSPADLVICDLGTPGINGLQVGKTVKKFCEESGIPKPGFIVLTGWSGMEQDKDEMHESGIDAVLEKPINMIRLLEFIRNIRSEKIKSAWMGSKR